MTRLLVAAGVVGGCVLVAAWLLGVALLENGLGETWEDEGE